MFAKVIVDIASSNVDKIFDYSFSSYPNIKAGTRVLVPFGNRAIEGIIIGFADKTNFDESKIKDIIRPLEEFPVINSDQFAIMNFLKRTFHIGNADALRLFLPSEMRQGKVRDLIERMVKLSKDAEEKIASVSSRANKQREAYSYLLDNPYVSHARLADKFSASAIKGLLDKGVIEIEEKIVYRKPYTEVGENKKIVNLTDTQQKVVDKITNEAGKYLLFGVTGSGKTEV